jgi:hypothetical protein
MKKLFILFVFLLSLQSIFSQTNISINKISTASAGISSTGAFDGDLTTAWNAVGFAPAWISVDLGSISSVSHIVFYVSQAPAGNTEHEVYSSIDGINWQIVETINLYTENAMEFTRNYTNLNGIRYLKILTISSPSWVAWYEISVFGTQEPTPPTVGLVAHYKFNGNTNDESGNNNNGLSSGGLTYTTDAFGNCNSACQFNGSDSFINIPNSATLQSPNQEITISTWIKANDINNNGAYFLCKNSLGNLDPFQYRMGLNHTAIFLGFKNSPTETIDLQVNTTISSNEWKFVASTYNGSIAKFYIDGVLVGTADYVGQIFQDDKSLDIGRDAHGPIEWFNGVLDNLRIYNQALNQQQITDLYNYEKPDPSIVNPQGLTVISHGFSPTFSDDWTKFANAIRIRNGGGAIYKNNPNTGQWELINGTLGVDSYIPDPTKELILVYDWASLSNNFSDGYLEASANNLFALLNNPPNAYSDILTKPKHFIGHSRGGILTLQLCYLLKKYLPNINIEHVTTLDPHPASPMGDVSQSNEEFSLPGVYGLPTSCSTLIDPIIDTGCSNGDNVYLKFPNNVLKLDNYYQKDGSWEGATSLGDFDGVEVRSASGYSSDNTDPNNFNRRLKTNDGLGNPVGCPYHTMVHDWYLATILPLATNISSFSSTVPLLGTNCTTTIPYEWFNVTSAGNDISAYYTIWGERNQIGYRQSRLGSIENCGLSLPLTNITNTIDINELDLRVFNRTGNQHQPVFNGNFQYKTAGWEKNNINQNVIPLNFENGYVELNNLSNSIVHSYFYFGKRSDENLSKNYSTLKFDIAPFDILANTILKISFFDGSSNLVQSYSFNISNYMQSNEFITMYCNIPEILNNKAGTFKIEITDNGSKVKIDNVTFSNCFPITNNLYITMPDPQTLLYTDVQNDDWFKEGVYKSRNYGLFRGTSFTTFSPDNNLTKAQAVTVLVRAGIKLGLISSYNTENTAYTDVDACNQYFPYIQTAKNLGYLDVGTTFNPEANITVADLCIYMDKILQINQHDWNNTTPWVIAPTSAYAFNQMSQIVINQTDPIKQNAMRRILNCIDVVKNDNIIDSYRTQNVWTLHNVENNTLSNGQPINVDGSATVTRARMAVAAANMFRFIYKKLNSGNAPSSRMANTTNTVTLDPSIDDFIGIGNTFDNKDIPETETPEAPTQIMFNINSGETLNLQYQSDTDTAGNPQFFYWSMNKNVDSNLANLVSVPINSIPNHRKVSFVAPVLTAPKTWYLYSYLANNKGKIKETVITINVSPSLGIDVLNGTIDLVKVYPNPVNDFLNIEATNAEIQKIELYDLQGKSILAEKVKTDNYKLNIAHLQNATYQLKLYTDKGIQSLKVVKK